VRTTAIKHCTDIKHFRDALKYWSFCFILKSCCNCANAADTFDKIKSNGDLLSVYLFYLFSTFCSSALWHVQCESKKNPPPWNFLTFFPKRLGIFSPNFTRLLYVPIYDALQIFIQLPATLTKLCHIKRDRHNVLKMCTIDRIARWVVTLSMA